MKKNIVIFTVLLLALTFCGCKKDSDAVYVSVKSEELIPAVSSLAEMYEKQSGTKIVINSKDRKADITEIWDASENLYNLNDLKIKKKVANSGFLLKNGDRIYGVPLKINCYVLAYNRNLIKNADSILTFDDLKITLDEPQGTAAKLTFFAPFSEQKYVTDLLSLPVFYELSQNDDYDSPVFAAKNAKQIAFRYADETKSVLDFIKACRRDCSESDAVQSLQSGEAAVALLNTEKLYGVKNESIGAFSLCDSEGKTVLLSSPQSYFGISKSSASPDLADDFLCFLAENSEKFDFLTPFLSGVSKTASPVIKDTARIISDGNVRIIPVLTGMFPKEFSDLAFSHITAYLNGEKDFSETESALKTLWKNDRSISQAQ